MRVAVLGAGMLGSCLAIELAQRGIYVDLFDREDKAVTQAGGRNEGKIHMGFVYGADPSNRTADLMLLGASRFLPLLKKWLGNSIEDLSTSSPFLYAVERSSLLSEEACFAYFKRLELEMNRYQRFEYPGGFDVKVEKLSKRQASTQFNMEKISSVFQTPERSVDVQGLALLIRNKIKTSKEISPRFRSEILNAEVSSDNVILEYRKDDRVEKSSYGIVVNALWDGRLAIDQTIGILEESPWSYRLKHAIFLKTDAKINAPSTTLIQGPYGDLVNFGGGFYYISWYPVCMKGFSRNQISPPVWNRNLSRNESLEMALESIGKLAEYIPCLKEINPENIQELTVLGGVIYAHGDTDVHDPKSGLHNRYQLNIRSKNGYYSINPGKYSLCPHFAYEIADQISEKIHGISRNPLYFPSDKTAEGLPT